MLKETLQTERTYSRWKEGSTQRNEDLWKWQRHVQIENAFFRVKKIGKEFKLWEQGPHLLGSTILMTRQYLAHKRCSMNA